MWVGGGRKFISALIVPNFDKLEVYARAKGIPFGSRKELVEREDPAHGARAEAVAMEHERAAGRGAGHVAAWGDGRSRVVDGGRAGEPVLDAEREADDS